jgi:hypothetical protein
MAGLAVLMGCYAVVIGIFTSELKEIIRMARDLTW